MATTIRGQKLKEVEEEFGLVQFYVMKPKRKDTLLMDLTMETHKRNGMDLTPFGEWGLLHKSVTVCK